MRRLSSRDYARLSWHARRKYDEAVRRDVEDRARRTLELDLDLHAITAARAIELLAFLPVVDELTAAHRRRILEREVAAAEIHQARGESPESFRRRVLDVELVAQSTHRRAARHNYPTNRKAAAS